MPQWDPPSLSEILKQAIELINNRDRIPFFTMNETDPHTKTYNQQFITNLRDFFNSFANFNSYYSGLSFDFSDEKIIINQNCDLKITVKLYGLTTTGNATFKIVFDDAKLYLQNILKPLIPQPIKNNHGTWVNPSDAGYGTISDQTKPIILSKTGTNKSLYEALIKADSNIFSTPQKLFTKSADNTKFWEQYTDIDICKSLFYQNLANLISNTIKPPPFAINTDNLKPILGTQSYSNVIVIGGNKNFVTLKNKKYDYIRIFITIKTFQFDCLTFVFV